MMKPTITIKDVQLYQGLLSRSEQIGLVDEVRSVAKSAPLFQPKTPSGKPMSVRMTAAGVYGWYSDARGYRYVDHHPNGQNWPDIPQQVMNIWKAVSGCDRAPECCLINFYDETAKMGMHQDRDEANFNYPVVSISLGDDALFRIGNQTRGGKTESLWLKSGDVLVMSGPSRLIYHGVDRVRFGSSSLLPQSGRINLTLRVVNP